MTLPPIAKEAPRPRTNELVGHGVAARGNAEDRDAARVAAEAGDVVADPLQGARLVGDAPVRAPVEVRVREVAEEAEAVLNLYEDDALVRQVIGGAPWLLRAAGLVVATVLSPAGGVRERKTKISRHS